MNSTISEIREKMTNLLEKDTANYLDDGINIFNAPLLGVADAQDLLFTRYRNEEHIIGSKFRKPEEWLPNAKTVISYFLPFSDEVRRSNYSPEPSMTYVHARFKGEDFSNKLRYWLVEELTEMGGSALAPLIEDAYYHDYSTGSSNWSERHVAYAAGLGTFNHGRSLITEKGCAGRFGSVITGLWFEPTKRNYDDPYSNCLLRRGYKCGKCIKRCPSGAITSTGKDKIICYEYAILKDLVKQEREKYGYLYSTCGKCQVTVPCEAGIPDGI